MAHTDKLPNPTSAKALLNVTNKGWKTHDGAFRHLSQNLGIKAYELPIHWFQVRNKFKAHFLTRCTAMITASKSSRIPSRSLSWAEYDEEFSKIIVEILLETTCSCCFSFITSLLRSSGITSVPDNFCDLKTIFVMTISASQHKP